MSKLFFLLVLVVVAMSAAPSSTSSLDCGNINDYFIKLTNSSHYHKWIKPSSTNDNVTTISVSMLMDRFAFYNDIESVLEIQAQFDFKWYDPRLRFDCGDNSGPIEGDDYHYSRIWTPNLRISRSENIDVFGSKTLSKLIFLRIMHDGQVFLRMRSNLNLICVMNYQSYPFDVQTCKIKLISSHLTSNECGLKWNGEKLFEEKSQFYITGHLLENYRIYQDEEKIRNETYSVLIVELNLRRQYIHYLLVLFLPCILIVATSWTSFWIDITSIPSRVALSVTTLLALVTVSKEAKQDIPKVSYIKALDLWFAGCIVSIFLSLIEYVIVIYVHREERNKLRARKRIKRSFSTVSFSSIDRHLAVGATAVPAGGDHHHGNGGGGKNNHHHHYHHHQPIFLSLSESNRMLNRRYSSITPPPAPSPTRLLSVPPALDSVNQIFGKRNSTSVEINDENNVHHPWKDTPQETALAIDRKCRYLFPLAFILFNLIYWSYL